MHADGIDQWNADYPVRSSQLDDILGARLYIATLVDATVLGSFVLDERQEPEYAAVPWTIRDAPVAVVHRLMVHPDHQRSGIARGLMAYAERQALELGFGAIRLDAFTGNAGALRLYDSLGYQAVGTVTFRNRLFRCFEKALQATPSPDAGTD